MANKLYITATEPHSGKSAIVLGIMETLVENIDKVGFFRPIIKPTSGRKDFDTEVVCNKFSLEIAYDDTYAYTRDEAIKLIDSRRNDDLMNGILSKFSIISDKYDFILCEGTDFSKGSSAGEFDLNTEIANNLNAPVLIVSNGNCPTEEEIISKAIQNIEAFEKKGCPIACLIINRARTTDTARLIEEVRKLVPKAAYGIYAITEDASLSTPVMGEVINFLKAELIYGKKLINQSILSYKIAASRIENVFKEMEEGQLVITPGDRVDVLLAAMACANSENVPTIGGVVLTSGIRPDTHMDKIIRGLPVQVPVLSVQDDIWTTAQKISNLHSHITVETPSKINTSITLFEKHVNSTKLFEELKVVKSSIMTPKMFEFGLIEKARKHKQRIVLPESNDDRIIQAAALLLERNAVDITLLGKKSEVLQRAAKLGVKLERAQIIDPDDASEYDDYVSTFFTLRKEKGITLDEARDRMKDYTYFATMMVYKGHADGMVSGALHTTADTIRPALQFIKMKPGFKIASSIFFMCLKDRVVVYGDCAIVQDPSAEELASIAIASANTAKIFGIDPIVALCSYSTGTSGSGEEVDKVRKAAELAKQMASQFKIEGPLQYDAASDPVVGRQKLPNSEVAGKATVFIFPDLNTGNNTYKAVQRTSGAVSIGPVMQGLRKPINDLSRGCTVPDVVNTIAITAIQAQGEKGLI